MVEECSDNRKPENFVTYIAKKTGLSHSTIYDSLQRASAFTDEQAEILKRCNVSKTTATKLARMEADKREAILKALAAGMSLSDVLSSVERTEQALIPRVSLDQDMTIVREWLRSKRSAHTQRAYLQDITAFYEQIQKPLGQVTLTDLQDYADYLRDERQLAVTTRARMLAAVKSLLTFAKDTGRIGFNVGTALQLPQGKDTLAQRILSQAQVQRMLFVAERSGNERNHVMLLLLYGSGIRCAELCNLQWVDVQETSQGGQITVLGKRQKTRSIALHPTVWLAIQAFRPSDAKPLNYVFQSRQTSQRAGKPSRRMSEVQVWRIVTTIAHEAGIKASTHWLRHAHATHAMEKNTPLKIIQETLGHADLRTPARYQHVRPETSSSLALDL